jgi:uncharacterized protein (TIGR02172 family)
MKEIPIHQPIARGRTADVYDWDAGHILKLFHNWFELEDIQYEMKMASAVHASGVKSPAVGDLIQVQGRNGLVYERVAGKSLLRMFQSQPWKVFQYGKIFAELHAQMHQCIFNNADVPDQRTRLQRKLERNDVLPVSLRSSLINALHSQPEADRVCHGDFHPDNVLIAGNDATVIDWIDASRGNPLADVARTSIILLGAAESSQIQNVVFKLFIKIFHSAYVKQYFHLRPGGEYEYQRWLPIVAGARLNENIPELEQWLIGQAKRVE